MAAPREHPQPDTSAVARFRNAMLDGPHGSTSQRRTAAAIEARWPGSREAWQQAAGFHGRAAVAAVANGARAVIFANAGIPAGGQLPHRVAAALAPDARFAYATVDEGLAWAWQDTVAADARAVAWQAAALDPPAVLGMAAMAGFSGPVSVQLQDVLHWWEPQLAAAVIAGYARHALFPPGSSLALSGALISGSARDEAITLLRQATGLPAYAHAPADVAGWVEAAGLVLAAPGIADARAWPLAEVPGGNGDGGGARYPGRLIGAFAVKP